MITVLLPFAIQLFHSLENHKHLACDNPDSIHIHNHELDCSVFHYRLNNSTINFSTAEISIDEKYTTEKIIATEDQNASAKLHHKSPRGPPFLLL